MKGWGMVALLGVVAVVAILGTVARNIGDNDEDAIRDAIRQGAAVMQIENLEIESVEVKGDRAFAMITFTEDGGSVKAAVVLEKVDGHWTADPTQWRR